MTLPVLTHDVAISGLRKHSLRAVFAALVALVACEHTPKAASSSTPSPLPRATSMCTLWQRGGETPLREIPCRNIDSDLDGIDDAVDLCPMLQEVENGIADGDGCPDPDPDQDGYADFEDACPQLAGVAPDGCPLIDKDRDFIADHLDACPNQPEDIDGEEDGDGCPEGVFRQRNSRALNEQVWLAEKLEVKPGSVKLSRQGSADFAQLTKQLTPHVEAVKKIRVVAYASVLETARGRAKRLAQRRVSRIRSKLRQMGFPKDVFSYSVYPLKNGGERVGRIEITVLVPLELSLDDLNTQPLSPASTQWIRPAVYAEEESAPQPQEPGPSSTIAPTRRAEPTRAAVVSTRKSVAQREEKDEPIAPKSPPEPAPPSAPAPHPVRTRHASPAERTVGAEQKSSAARDARDKPAAGSALSRSQSRVEAEPSEGAVPTDELADANIESPRRASQLFEDDELPDEDPRERKALRAPAPTAKTRIDLNALDDNDEDILLFEDDASGEELDLPEGDAAEQDVLFFGEPEAPKAADWEAAASN